MLWAQQQLFSPQLLLPFTTCQLAAVEERAVVCIARLLAFSNTCVLPEVGSPGALSSGTTSWLPSQSPPVSRLAQSLGWALLPTQPCCLSPQLCTCFVGTAVFQHKCQENQRFPVLGKLVGHLILSCTSTDDRTRDEAINAVHQLFIFIAAPSERSCVGLGPSRCPDPSLTPCVLLSRTAMATGGAHSTTALGQPNFAPPGGFP